MRTARARARTRCTRAGGSVEVPGLDVSQDAGAATEEAARPDLWDEQPGSEGAAAVYRARVSSADRRGRAWAGGKESSRALRSGLRSGLRSLVRPPAFRPSRNLLRCAWRFTLISHARSPRRSTTRLPSA